MYKKLQTWKLKLLRSVENKNLKLMTKLLLNKGSLGCILVLLVFGCSPTDPENIFDVYDTAIWRVYWVLGITIILLIVSVSINIYQYKKGGK